ncbi:hypothetical protein DMENIID0001_028370 [Sergentomyia squamirostris]
MFQNHNKSVLTVKSVNDIRTELSRTNYFEPQSRIINGIDAISGQFPYYVRITIFEGYLSSCGGIILAANWILTAGHCVKSDSGTYSISLIEAGFVSILPGLPSIPSQIISPVPLSSSAHLKVFIHPLYTVNDVETVFDIAIIHVNSDFSFNLNGPNVKAVALPQSTYTVTDTYANKMATVCGFGLTSNEGSTSTTLKYTALKIIPYSTCQEIYGADEVIPLTSFCGVHEAPTAVGAMCSGDSGGPVVLTIDNVVTVIGVVSYASKDGCNTKPQGFTDILQMLPWITDTMAT